MSGSLAKVLASASSGLTGGAKLGGVSGAAADQFIIQTAADTSKADLMVDLSETPLETPRKASKRDPSGSPMDSATCLEGGGSTEQGEDDLDDGLSDGEEPIVPGHTHTT